MATSSLLNFSLTADQIKSETQRLIDESRRVRDIIAALPSEQRTFDSVVVPLADDEARMSPLSSNVTFPGYVSTDKAVRETSTNAQEEIEKYEIEASLREDVYEALKTVKQRQYDSLNHDQKRLLDKMLLDFERMGLALPKETRDKVKQLNERLSQLGIQFTKNLNEENSKHLFTREELEGLPEDFINALPEKDGKKALSLKVPEVLPVMQLCKVEETRRRVEFANSSKCQEQNVPLFEEAIAIRQQLAELLGYKDHAVYRLEVRMAKDPQTVNSFLNSLVERLLPFGKKELQHLVDLKSNFKAERKEQVAEKDQQLHAYDFNFYHTLMKERDYQVNEYELQQYFPLQRVISAMLQFVQETFGLRFKQVDNPQVWMNEVTQYQVFDAEGGNFVGEFYLDLFPREGKYGHFAAFPLQSNHIRSDGSRQHPVSAMVCNFTKPTADKPSLLKHNEVVTLLHEFGHLCHGFCSKARYGRFSGTSVERDFVECPSQFMENFCYEKEFLRRVSSHYKTGEPLPDTQIDKLIAAKNLNVALLTLRQLFFGVFDMTVHTSNGKVNSADLYAKLRQEISLLPNTAGTNPVGSFGHLMGGYDVGYYGYMWSEVYSADIFSVFKSKGIFNPAVGKLYRESILEQGHMKDGFDMLRTFLGREPSSDAFMRDRGMVVHDDAGSIGAETIV